MPMCFVFGCNHQALRDTCRFFRFPSQLPLAKKWEKLCRRKDKTLNCKYDRICSCHSKDSIKENGPTVFPWNNKVFFDFPDPRNISRKSSRKEYASKESDEAEIQTAAGSPVDHEYHLTYEKLAEYHRDSTQKVKHLEEKIQRLSLKRPFTLGDIVKDEKKMLMYTSLRPDMFDVVDETLQRFPINYIDGWTPTFISRTDQLLMTLMKLTMNIPHLDLAERFNTSQSSVINIITSQICAMHEVFYEGMIENRIPSLQKCKGSMPSSFGDFSSCRLVIDATEISQDVPGNDMRLQACTYSGYKNTHTVKSVTGVAPNGAIVFVSTLYPGSTSDVAIVEHCGLMQHMVPGDMILADKGFTIHKLLPQGVHLNIPPFLTGKSQYTPSEVQLCRKIARSRIHVERANERIKNYAILRHIPHQFRYISTKIFQLCCALVSFQDPLIQEIAQTYVSDSHGK